MIVTDELRLEFRYSGESLDRKGFGPQQHQNEFVELMVDEDEELIFGNDPEKGYIPIVDFPDDIDLNKIVDRHLRRQYKSSKDVNPKNEENEIKILVGRMHRSKDVAIEGINFIGAVSITDFEIIEFDREYDGVIERGSINPVKEGMKRGLNKYGFDNPKLSSRAVFEIKWKTEWIEYEDGSKRPYTHYKPYHRDNLKTLSPNKIARMKRREMRSIIGKF